LGDIQSDCKNDGQAMIKYGVSIVVCTYNGAPRLPETIRCIALQNVPKHIHWEFIIIDNASTDGTQEVSRAEWAKYNCSAPLIIVHEPKAGLSYARSRGFASASYEYILMCDDDNWLAEDYVKLVYEIMSNNTNIGALGGKGKLVFEIDPPAWVKEFSVFAGGAQAPKSGLVKRNTLYGAGCVIRKSGYNQIINAGFRSLLTDRLGKELSSGGDYELCYALVMAGYDIWYDERLTFKHYIPKDRYTKEYYLKYLKESSKCFEVLEPYKIICERKLINFKNFRIMMYKLLFYYLRRYALIQTLKILFRKDSVYFTILSLRSYSIHMKITLLLRNRKTVFENYKHGKAFEQKFVRPDESKSIVGKAVQAMFY
jgi:glycosyltransferase involved in cell wall biosynthesis